MGFVLTHDRVQSTEWEGASQLQISSVQISSELPGATDPTPRPQTGLDF